jgi:hypothetical protein
VRASDKLDHLRFSHACAEQVDGAVSFDRVQGKNHSGDTQRSCFRPSRQWISHLGNYYSNDLISDATSKLNLTASINQFGYELNV